ncbi:MAG: adenylate/guanylate cyclase domain-containing protein [Chloroflexaceae bacterium]|nr:adenylate/guanylate cyclase domain-containing protein [Chloroflexaceae bacterium]
MKRGRNQQIKQWLWDWRGVWIAAPSVTALIVLVRWLGGLQALELSAFDAYVSWRPPQPPDDRIAIVGIDEADIREIGQAIVPDRDYAQLIAKLRAMGPRAIGLDIYRDLPVEPGRKQLDQVFATTPNLVGIQKAIGDRAIDAVAPPEVLKSKGQVGANDLITDPDQKIRRGFLSLTTQSGETLPSFGLYLAALSLEAEGISLEVVPGTNNWWQLGSAIFSPFEARDGGYSHADAGGYQILLNYRGDRGHFETVSMMDILQERVAPDWGRDRVILIGFVGESFKDTVATPYTTNPSQRMAGVEVHANLTSQILSAALDRRSLIDTWPEPLEGLWIFFWAGIGATLAWQKRYVPASLWRSLQDTWPALLLLSVTYGAFLLGWWLPVVPPLLAFIGAFAGITAYIARSAGQIRHTFGRYLSTEIVATLLESAEGLKLGGERRKLTLLTSDLRGFTALSERLPPEEVVRILNFYLGAMAEVIAEYRGTIDEFMGDGILVLFGAPIARPDDAERALACAIAMQLAMEPINKQLADWGYPALEMGIGINTGEVVVGNLGSEKRTKYGVVGSQVNLTYRIESYTVGGQILAAETTLQAIGTGVITLDKRQVTPKGVQRPLTIYEIRGITRPNYNLSLEPQKEELLSLNKSIFVKYSLLDGKDISDRHFEGQLTELSASGAILRPLGQRTRIVPLCNIRLNLLSITGCNDDIYAKVMECRESQGVRLHFTAIPPDLKTHLSNLYLELAATHHP